MDLIHHGDVLLIEDRIPDTARHVSLHGEATLNARASTWGLTGREFSVLRAAA